MSTNSPDTVSATVKKHPRRRRAMPHRGRKPKVLVVDKVPDTCRVRDLFGPGVLYYGAVPPTSERVGAVFGDDFEITTVNSREAAINAIKSHYPPYYSLVVYSDSFINESGIAGTIAGIHSRDPFMPQLAFGETVNAESLGQARRAGCLYYAQNSSQLAEWNGRLFRPAEVIKNLTIAKLGGSAWDHDRQVPGSTNIDKVIRHLVRKFRDREEVFQEIRGRRTVLKKRRRVKHRVLITVGAGQFGDIYKDYHKKYRTTQYPLFMAQAIELNLQLVRDRIGEKDSIFLSTGAFYMINDNSTRKAIPLLGMAPHYVLARDGIPLQDSDTHTIALAEHYGARRVILIKRTDGIYAFNPYFGCIMDPEKGKCVSADSWSDKQRNNRQYNEVSIDQLMSGDFRLEGVDAKGGFDDTLGHLMEFSALEYLAKCRYVQEVVVVHVAPEEMYMQLPRSNTYVHVITGDPVQINTQLGWYSMVRRNIDNAFEGIGPKIVKG